MDNITHAFVGAAIAECALPPNPSATARRIFLAAGVAAASAADLDLIYTGITEPPLGYLLHHRGHTHTLPGLVMLGVLMFVACRAWSAAWTVVRPLRVRWLVLVGAALGSHLLMDTANAYGTHLLYPFSARWFFGDAVFILEPWLWLVLGTPLMLNTRNRGLRAAVAFLTFGPMFAMWYARLIPVFVLAAIALAGAAIAITVRRSQPKRRATVALAAAAATFALMCGLSRVAEARILQSVPASGRARILDVVLNPNPGMPWCWSTLVLEIGEGSSDLITRGGTMTLAPRLWPASSCTSYMAVDDRHTVSAAPTAELAWGREWRTDVDDLRRLAETDCRVRAWLQFGRVPFVGDNHITDLRFQNAFRQNFSTMRLDSRTRGCPANLTNWEPPRQDVLAVSE